MIFDNSDDNARFKNDEKVTILVERDSPEGFANPVTERDGAEIFSGSENNLRYLRLYSEKLDCTFDLRSYPFDSQLCAIVLVVQKSSENQVELEATASFYNGTLTLPQFEVRADFVSFMIINHIWSI